MNRSSRRRAYVVVAFVAGGALLASSGVLAAPAGPTPPGPPVCGSVASLMNRSITAARVNIISVPAVSPVNNNPTDSSNNGFQQLCRRFSLVGTTTEVTQFNPQLGSVQTFICNQAVTSDNWTPGQAAYMIPSTGATGRIPGVECAQPYTSYGFGSGKGNHLYPVPLTITTNSKELLCQMLNLPAGSKVIDFNAGTGNVDQHLCGAVPVVSMRLGEGVFITEVPGTAGVAVATGTPTIY